MFEKKELSTFTVHKEEPHLCFLPDIFADFYFFPMVQHKEAVGVSVVLEIHSELYLHLTQML